MVEIIGLEHEQGSKGHRELVERLIRLPKAVIGLELSPLELDSIRLVRSLREFEMARRDLRYAPPEASDRYRAEMDVHAQATREILKRLGQNGRAKVSFGARFMPPMSVGAMVREAQARLAGDKAAAPTLRSLNSVLDRHYFANVALSLLNFGHEVVGIESHAKVMEADRRVRSAGKDNPEGNTGLLDRPGIYKSLAYDRSKAMANNIAAQPALTHVAIGKAHADHLRDHFLDRMERTHRQVKFSAIRAKG